MKEEKLSNKVAVAAKRPSNNWTALLKPRGAFIVKKVWRLVSFGGTIRQDFEGWFLFGVLPVYIRQI